MNFIYYGDVNQISVTIDKINQKWRLPVHIEKRKLVNFKNHLSIGLIYEWKISLLFQLKTYIWIQC